MASLPTKTKVLILDNDTIYSEHLKEHLRLKGYMVWASSKVEEAKSLLNDISDFNFLIINFNIIQDNLTYFKKHLPPHLINIVSVEEENIGKTIEPVQIFAYISKPISFEKLTELLEKGSEQQQSNIRFQKEEELNTLKQVEDGIKRQITDPLNHINAIIDNADGDLVGEDVDLLKKEFEKAKQTIEALKALNNQPGIETTSSNAQEILLEAYHLSDINHDIEVEWEFPSKEIHVNNEHGQLLNALTHLIKNASESMNEQGRLTIRLNEQNNKVKITIIDQGKGLDQLTKKRVFDPFFSSKDKVGLGMNIALDNIQNLGGKLIITESIPNQGTTILISVPLVK